MRIKDLPETERPYEKLELYGERSLSNAELLAIIIKTGTKNYTSIDIARQILNLNDLYDRKSLSFLKEVELKDLQKIKGVGKVKALQIKAICELANRMNIPTNFKKVQIKKPEDIVKIVKNEMQDYRVEIAKIVLLDNRNYIVKIKDVAMGGNNFVSIGVKNILSEAVKLNVPKMILIHNHPSGLSIPSTKDYDVTKKLTLSAKTLGIELVDHIVIGQNEFTSMKTIEKFNEEFSEKSDK